MNEVSSRNPDSVPRDTPKVRFADWAREVGWSRALLITLSHKLPDRLLRLGRGEVWGGDLNRMLASPRANGDLEFRWATPEEIGEIRSPGFRWETIDRIGVENLLCAVAITAGGEMAGYEMFLTGSYQSAYSPVRVMLKPDQIWAIYAYVPPAFRGRRLTADLADFARGSLLEKGYRYMYGLVRLDNELARAAYRKRGQGPQLRVSCLRAPGLTVLRADGRTRVRFTGRRGFVPLELPPATVEARRAGCVG